VAPGLPVAGDAVQKTLRPESSFRARRHINPRPTSSLTAAFGG
jgi:hypothetical protein